MSFFFIVIFSKIQHMGYASQSGLQNFLFGKAASLVIGDVLTISILELSPPA